MHRPINRPINLHRLIGFHKIIGRLVTLLTKLSEIGNILTSLHNYIPKIVQFFKAFQKFGSLQRILELFSKYQRNFAAKIYGYSCS